MTSIVFAVEETEFTLTFDEYSKSKLLLEMSVLPDVDRIPMENVTLDQFQIVYDFLKNDKIPSIDEFCLVEYFGLSFRRSYGLSCLIEDDMRDKMYSNDADPKYLEPYYGLYILDKHLWETVRFHRESSPDLLFDDVGDLRSQRDGFRSSIGQLDGFTPTPSTWNEIQERLEELRYLMEDGVVIAGGAIFSILFRQKINDIDLFIYEKTEVEANRIIERLVEKLAYKGQEPINIKEEDLSEFLRNLPLTPEKVTSARCTVSRSKNSVTIHVEKQPDIQIILRLYQTQSEIISGFDCDSCCLGWDSKSLFITYRGLYSLDNLTNTVNFDRLSPSYERRLAKYASRGIAVRVPNFDRSKVNVDFLEKDLFRVYPTQPGKSNIYQNMSKLRDVDGLSVLLLLEKFAEKVCYRERFQRLTSRLSSAVSDYAFASFGYRDGSTLEQILNHMECQGMTPDYFDSSDRYMPLFRELGKRGIHFYDGDLEYCDDVGSKRYPDHTMKELMECLNFRVSSPFMSKSCYLLRGDPRHLKLILHFPKIYRDLLETVRPVDFPADIEWKTTLPGEQMTNTFHSIVLEDNNEWYKGRYYNNLCVPKNSSQIITLSWDSEIDFQVFESPCLIKYRSKVFAYNGKELIRIKNSILEKDIYPMFSTHKWEKYIGRHSLRLLTGDYEMLTLTRRHQRLQYNGVVYKEGDNCGIITQTDTGVEIRF